MGDPENGGPIPKGGWEWGGETEREGIGKGSPATGSLRCN